MPMPSITEARQLSDEALSSEILAVKKELFELRLQQATRQLTKPHQIKLAKHRLAQLMTVEGERQRGVSINTKVEE
ncbi:MAG: 50S ribosomal protein L29 [Synechococcales cyanobacterium]